MEFIKKNAGVIIFVVILGFVVWYFFLRNKKAESGYRGVAPFKRRLDFMPGPSAKGKWVSSIEDGKPYCRWYDANGNNTVTYNKPCTPAQANM